MPEGSWTSRWWLRDRRPPPSPSRRPPRATIPGRLSTGVMWISRALPDFGEPSLPLTRFCRTTTRPLARSTSFQRRARSSPCRMPVRSASSTIVRHSPSAAAKRRSLSSNARKSNSGLATLSHSTSGTCMITPRLRATTSMRRRIVSVLFTVLCDRPSATFWTLRLRAARRRRSSPRLTPAPRTRRGLFARSQRTDTPCR